MAITAPIITSATTSITRTERSSLPRQTASDAGEVTLKILQINKCYPPHIGGIERMVEGYAHGLIARGHQATVLCFQDDATPTAIENPQADLTVHRLGARIRSGKWAISRAFFSKLQQLAATNDVLHFHEPFPVGAMAGAALTLNKPIIVSWHADVMRLGPLKHALDKVQAQLCQRAAQIICLSSDVAQSSRVLGPHLHKVTVIPPGLTLPVTHGQEAELIERRATQLAAQIGRPFILCVGRLVPYKGYDVLLNAMAQTKATVVIIGKGELHHALMATAAELGVTDRLHIIETVTDSELRAWYRACTVFALPSVSKAEAFGLVQIEAMVAGKPIINTALETAVPIVSPHGVTGLTVAPHNADQLASAIARLMSDQTLRETYGAAARQRAQTLYSNTAMMDALLGVYANATGLKP
jgi:glycosyltransferase involved in cell wall biosynthesis